MVVPTLECSKGYWEYLFYQGSRPFQLCRCHNDKMALQTTQLTPISGDEDHLVKAELETLSKDLRGRLAESVKVKDTFELTDDRAKLGDFVARVKEEHDKLQKSRLRSKRGIGIRISRLCANISRLLSHYAGLAELIKSIDSRAGPLVYGALAVTLSVCTKLFRTISKSCLSLRFLQHLSIACFRQCCSWSVFFLANTAIASSPESRARGRDGVGAGKDFRLASRYWGLQHNMERVLNS